MSRGGDSGLTVGMNCRVLSKPTRTGVGRYTGRLLESLAARAKRDAATYTLFGVGPDDPDREFDREGFDAVRDAGEPAWAHSGVRAHLWEQFELPRVCPRYDLDVLHTPAGNPPVLGSVPLVTTIHDISPVVHPEWFATGYATLYRAVTPLAVRRSAAVITVSEFSASELADAYPSAAGKIRAVHNGVTPPPPGTPPAGVSPSAEFLLFVGSVNPRKNVEGLLTAYRRYRESADWPAKLLLAGAENDVFATPKMPSVDGAHALGYVGDAELGWLYRNARALVFPSKYEGFGLPILEAMSVGTPVVTSDRGAMAEVAGDAACLVDADDPGAIAAGMERVDADPEYRETLARAGRGRAGEFTWERTAERTAAVYRDVADGG
jgi:glycosyltransferase involved in cell wall biosynthesis